MSIKPFAAGIAYHSAILSGKENCVDISRGIIMSGTGIWLRLERCEDCGAMFTVVRTPKTHETLLPCPECEPKKVVELASSLARDA